MNIAFGMPYTRHEIIPLGHAPSRKHWLFEFSNGYGASVIGGPFCYGDGVNTFELAVLKDEKIVYDTPLTDDVLAWQSEEEIERALKEIKVWEGDTSNDDLSETGNRTK